MAKKIDFLLLLVVAPLVVAAGCAHQDEGDTSPMPAVDPQTRLSKATKTIEESNMTPEQKKAALDYVKHGAEASEKMKQNAKPPAGKP